ncbi:MAG: hypothetical protein JWM11_38 [Planctomycetaceae bacterium]|nr:hypothetical protein [Planctomycetaceae bacterium]
MVNSTARIPGLAGLIQRSPALIGVLCSFLNLIPVIAGELPNKESGSGRFLLQWGTEGTETGEFHFPIGIAVSKSDEIYVTDFYNDRVQKFDTLGKFQVSFAVAPHPGGIAIAPDGNVFVSHFGVSKPNEVRKPDRITVYSPAGKPLREWGQTGTANSEFDMPGGLAIDKAGRVYVADQTNRRIQVFSGSGEFLAKWGEYGTANGQFGGNVSPKSRVGGPNFVAIDSLGNIYTTEASVGRVQKFTPQGQFQLTWGNNENKRGSFGGLLDSFKLVGPVGICIDQKDRVWVSAVGGRIQQFASDGTLLQGFGEKTGTEPGEFRAPHGVALDSQGNLYVVDAFNHRIQKFDVGP